MPRTPWRLGYTDWSGGKVLRTLLIPHSPHCWRRRIFLCVLRGTISCHRRRRVAVIGAHNTVITTVSPKCCRATVSRRWLRHGHRLRSRWAVTRLSLPVTPMPEGTRIRCKTYSPSTPTAYKAQRFYFGRGGQMLTGNYALSDVCFNTVSRLPHQSAGKDVRSCLFLTSLLNPMRSNVLRFPHGFVSSYA